MKGAREVAVPKKFKDKENVLIKNALDLYISIYLDPEWHWKKGMHVMFAYLQVIDMAQSIPLPLKESKIQQIMTETENYMNVDLEERVRLTKHYAEKMIEILCRRLDIPIPREVFPDDKPNILFSETGQMSISTNIKH